MADYLLVVDMQSDYVAVGKAYHEELTAAVNDKIATYPSERVIYILNRFFWERKDRKIIFCPHRHSLHGKKSHLCIIRNDRFLSRPQQILDSVFSIFILDTAIHDV